MWCLCCPYLFLISSTFGASGAQCSMTMVCPRYSLLKFFFQILLTLRKHAYSNILNILPPKNENFRIKIRIFFLISAQNIDCGYSLEPPWRGCSNEYQQSVFWSRNKNNNVYSCKPQFYYIKVGFKGVNIIKACFHDDVREVSRFLFSRFKF